jgi:hypothetical protein
MLDKINIQLAYSLADLLGGEAEARAWLEQLEVGRDPAFASFVSPDNRALIIDELTEVGLLGSEGPISEHRRELGRLLELIPLIREAEDARRPAPASRLVCTIPAEVSLPSEMRYVRRSLKVLVEDSLRSLGERVLLAAPYWSSAGTELLRCPLQRAIDRQIPITLGGARREDLEHHAAMVSFGRELYSEGGSVSVFSFRPPREKSLFHAKIVAGRRGYLGTGNLSIGGFEDNVEVGLPLDETDVVRVWWLLEQLAAAGLLEPEDIF